MFRLARVTVVASVASAALSAVRAEPQKVLQAEVRPDGTLAFSSL